MAHESRSADLERLRDGNRAAEARLAEALAETERFAASRSVGVPLAAALETFVSASKPDASLRSLAFERFAGASEVRFSGIASDQPMPAVRALKSVESELEQSALLHSVWIAPPTVRGREHGAGGLPFEGRAEWEAQR